MNAVKIREISQDYYANEAKKMRKVADKILSKFGGLCQSDYDDFYGLATSIFLKAAEDFDEEINDNFDIFFKDRLTRKFIQHFRDLRRFKRCSKKEIINENGEKEYIFESDARLDAPLGEDSEATLVDSIPGESNVFDFGMSEEMEEYLNGLSPLQSKIIAMMSNGMNNSQIMKCLGISKTKYDSLVKDMMNYERTKKLDGLYKINKVDDEEEEVMSNTTMEKVVNKLYSVESMRKQIMRNNLTYNFALQRDVERWSALDKSNQMSDMAQNNPFPGLVFGEVVREGVQYMIVIDGKQRISNFIDFMNDGFKISKNVGRYLVDYVDGGKVQTFDIRGKKFSDFPEALQDKFRDYTFNVSQYINCTPEELNYHLLRYNRGVRMNNSEISLVLLGEEKAEIIREIAESPFFNKDNSSFKNSEEGNGVKLKCIAECVLATFFIEDWKPKAADMCEYVRDIDSSYFYKFEEMATELESVVTPEVKKMFTSTMAFVYFALFSKAKKYDLSASDFVEFLNKLNTEINSTVIDGVSWNVEDVENNVRSLLKSRNNRDRSVVAERVAYLDKLMKKYFRLDEEETEQCFVEEAVNCDIDDDTMSLIEDSLDDYTLEVDNSSALMSDKNRKSLLGVVAYAFIKDIDPAKWFVDYFARNTSFIANQMENYKVMKKDFDTYYAVA